MNKEKEIIIYKGKHIEELTKEELMEAVIYAAAEIKRLQAIPKDYAAMILNDSPITIDGTIASRLRS